MRYQNINKGGLCIFYISSWWVSWSIYIISIYVKWWYHQIVELKQRNKRKLKSTVRWHHWLIANSYQYQSSIIQQYHNRASSATQTRMIRIHANVACHGAYSKSALSYQGRGVGRDCNDTTRHPHKIRRTSNCSLKEISSIIPHRIIGRAVGSGHLTRRNTELHVSPCREGLLSRHEETRGRWLPPNTTAIRDSCAS